jgi:hypothetical protein
MNKKEKLQKILDKIVELEDENVGGGLDCSGTQVGSGLNSSNEPELHIKVNVDAVKKETIQPTKKRSKKVKEIIDKADKLNKRHRPHIIYQGGSKLYIDEVDYWSDGDEFECEHCGGAIQMKKAAEEMNIFKKSHRTAKAGQLDWNRYITEVSKLPEMIGKPRSRHMKFASQLKGNNVGFDDIKKYNGNEF